MSLGSQFGLLSTGFVGKQTQDITNDLNAAMQAAFGASINLTAQSRFGQVIGIMSARYLELWNLLGSVHSAFSPDQASGMDLVQIAALTGTNALIPTPSTVLETCTGTPGTVLPSGRQVNVQATGSTFQTAANATIAALTAWAQSTLYSLVGTRRSANGNSYQLTVAGTSSNVGTGPSGTGSAIVDGTCTWEFLGNGTGAVDVVMNSVENGNIVAAPGTLTLIQTPVAGWSSATNLLAATPGAQAEADAIFRARREAELHGPGLAAVEAILAAVLKVSGVTAATVFENVTDSTNSDGMPPHSVEVLAQGTFTPLTLCTAIFQSVAAGIATTGNQAPVTVTDSQGITHAIAFSEPVDVDIWVIVNLTADPRFFPLNGATQVTNNIMSYASTLATDYDVISGQLAAAIVAGVPALGVAGVPGILDPGFPLIGTSNPPVSSNPVSITSRQLATFDPARITVNVSFGSP